MTTREHVWLAFRQAPHIRLRKRCHGMVLAMEGTSCPEMAPWLDRDEDTSRGGGHACNEGGLQGLEREGIPGRPACLTADQRPQVNEAVGRWPWASGSHMRVWSRAPWPP